MPPKRNQVEQPAWLPPPTDPPDVPAKVLIQKEWDSFSRSNPFASKHDIDALCGPVRDAKALRSGVLLVETYSLEQTMAIMATKKFADCPVRAELADKIALVYGPIRSDALTELSNQELLDELEPQGVTVVKRLNSRNSDHGPNPAVTVVFCGPLP